MAIIFPKPSTLHAFQPRFYRAGPMRFHLAFFRDLVAELRPRTIVNVGFSEGVAFFTLCQAVREERFTCECIAFPRALQALEDDEAWERGVGDCAEFYGDFARLEHADPRVAIADFPEGSVDLLLIDDSDSAAEIDALLLAWETKLSAKAILLMHGIGLERADGPAQSWERWTEGRSAIELSGGIGLGVAECRAETGELAGLIASLRELRGANPGLDETYALVAARIDAEARAADSARAAAALKARQIWLNSILADRWKAQQVMDHQKAVIAEIEQRFAPLAEDRAKAQTIMDAQAAELAAERSAYAGIRADRVKAQEILDAQKEELGAQAERFQALREDRAKAQLVIDHQHAELQETAARAAQLQSEIDALKAATKAQKKILSEAKKACRRGGRCFQLSDVPKEPRTIGERMARELRRVPRNLRKLLPVARVLPEKTPPPISPPAGSVEISRDRYPAWISEHEPDAAELLEQRRTSALWPERPKISLLLPVFNPPPNFLVALLETIAAQTYDHWETCIVDGGSSEAQVTRILEEWGGRDPRFRIVRLPENLGISENTNHALRRATGDFIVCIDHDDLLAPDALYEMARAVLLHPDADIIYSDEDRCDESGRRHTPFFKPEWSPALLISSMYLGHLTAYRRALANGLGGFRKQFDLSQDYDFALRATEQAKEIRHVPHVLYHWREHPESGSAGGKPEARRTNLAALAEAMRRRNRPAEIIEYPTANRARLRIEHWPQVSVIVPTDSPERAKRCVFDLPERTDYPNWEIVVVTNGGLAQTLGAVASPRAKLRVVPYDRAFNFSDKANTGADAATGERLIFLNDDVEATTPDWIQNVIEPLENPEVGAVAPKLLYETGKIQHAGLVTGVRGLVGTAFHQQPAETTMHANLAQSLRDVAALSGACLAVRRADFIRLGGFDAVQTPVANSDFDLCFKIRAAGMRCVYTPFVTLNHTGHVSIGAGKETKPLRRQEKSNLYLLKRWAGYTTHDPYFTKNMRDWLYADSPTPIRMSGRNEESPPATTLDLLLVSHDLSLSGAPMMLFHAAVWCRSHGIFPVVMSPKEGPMRAKFEAAGIPLIVDPLIVTGHKSFVRLARDFDCVIANTILSGAIVYALRHEAHPVLWWMHETMAGEHFLNKDPQLRAALPLADVVMAPSEQSAAIYRPYLQRSVRCLRNAIPEPEIAARTRNLEKGKPLQFLVLGTVEPRKGQDIFARAVALVAAGTKTTARFQICGQVTDPAFGEKVKTFVAGVSNFVMEPGVDHAGALGALFEADVVVCSSRDEAMPTVTMLEAMSLGKTIISTSVGGASEFLIDGANALLVRPEDPAALAAAMNRVIEDRFLRERLGHEARRTYRERFTIERFGREFVNIVQDAVKAGKRPT